MVAKNPVLPVRPQGFGADGVQPIGKTDRFYFSLLTFVVTAAVVGSVMDTTRNSGNTPLASTSFLLGALVSNARRSMRAEFGQALGEVVDTAVCGPGAAKRPRPDPYHALITRVTRRRMGAVLRVQRWWRRWRALRPFGNGHDGAGADGFVRCDGKCVADPCTLERVPVANALRLVSPDGHVFAYDAPTLRAYLSSSGDFTCPLGRFEFSRPQVRAIARGDDALDRARLLKRFDDRRARSDQRRELDDQVEGMERLCAEIISAGLRAVEDEGLFSFASPSLETGEEAMANLRDQLESRYFTEWRAQVGVLASLDRGACVAMVGAEIARLERLEATQPDPHHVLQQFLGEARGMQRTVEGMVLQGFGRRRRNAVFELPAFQLAAFLGGPVGGSGFRIDDPAITPYSPSSYSTGAMAGADIFDWAVRLLEGGGGSVPPPPPPV